MDVSPAPRAHGSDITNAAASSPEKIERPDGILAPKRRASPLRHGLTVGIATAASFAVIEFSLLSVIGIFAPKHHVLNATLLAIAIAVGIYAGIRALMKQRNRMDVSGGRCADCGRELRNGEEACPNCRPETKTAL
jgi:hypothetical protein